MSHFKRWHLVLIPIPVVGWLLLAAYWLDETRPRAAPPGVQGSATSSSAPHAARVWAACIDLAIAIAAWFALPPSAAWLLASGYLLFRDAGDRPFGLGKRLLGIRTSTQTGESIGYTRSFERNLPLLVPYLGLLVEGVIVARGASRLGDRLARTRVR